MVRKKSDWYKNNRERIKQRYKIRYKKIQQLVFDYYCKGVIKCACCPESDIRFLTIDHIAGRKKFNHPNNFTGLQLWSWLFKNNFPSGFQILCYNCNCAKGRYGICPHQSDKQSRIKILDDELKFLGD